MNLIEHAKREFELMGWPGEDTMQKAMCDGVLALLEVFGNQGHSGFSANYAIGIFDKLVRFQTIGPLTGEDDEWNEVSEDENGKLYQNRRDSEVFKDDNGPRWINGIIFRDADGSTYTSSDSHVPIKFPWTRPKSEIVDRPS